MKNTILIFVTLFCVTTLSSAEDPYFETIPQKTLLQYLGGKGNFELIDARSEAEYDAGHIYGAVNVPHDSDLDQVTNLPANSDTAIVVYCKSGKRASSLREKLLAKGYSDVRVLGPAQMIWSGEMPVFNCGTSAASPSVAESIDTALINTGDTR